MYRGTIWCLATIEDLATRQIVDGKIGKRHDSYLIMMTLQQAFAACCTPTIFHADQGTESMAQRCADYLEDRGVHISVGDVASP